MKNNTGFSYCNVVGQTDVGKIRKANEDHGAHFETLNGLVAVVCDGMGGHVGGAVASEVAIRTIHEFLDCQFFQDPREAIGLAIDAANKAIIKQAELNPELEGMGSTCVLLIVRDGKVYIGHVGDSRIYLIREKTIVQLTKDHSFVQSLVDIGQITKEQAEHHPRKNEITNALGLPGMSPATVREEPIDPQAGDCFLLCSDGLSGMVSDHEIEKIVSRQRDFSSQQRADLLVQAANNNGGMDNITVELVEFTITPVTTLSQKTNKSRLFKIIIPAVCAIAAVCLALVFLKPKKHEVIRTVMPDLENSSIIQITNTGKKNEFSIRVLPQAKEYTIKDKIDFAGIESNLGFRDINDGIEFYLSEPFSSDSAFVVIPGAHSTYRYIAKVNKSNETKTVVLQEVVFRSLGRIGTIYKDSKSIQIAIEGSGTTISVDDILSDIEVIPSSVVSQTNDYKIVLQFPKTFAEEEVVLSFKTAQGNCRYIIPVVRQGISIAGDLLRDLVGQKPDDTNKPGKAQPEEVTTPADSTDEIDKNQPEQPIKTISPVRLLVPIEDKPLLIISDGREITYTTALGTKRLPLAELESVSCPKIKPAYDNDKYIFSVSDPKSGDQFIVTVLGKDKDGQRARILLTLKYE